MTENENHKRGHPSFAKQRQIDDDLHWYYLRTCSISTTSKITGYDRKTIARRFKMWGNNDVQKLNQELDKGDTIHKIEFLNLNQSLIDDALFRLDEIKKDITIARQNDGMNLSQLYSNEDQIRRTLQSLNEKRCAVKIKDGAQRVIEKVLEARVRGYVQSTSTN